MRLPGEDGFAVAWEAADAELTRRMATAFEAPAPWRVRIRRALAAALGFLAEDGERAHLYVADVIFSDEALRARRLASLAELSAIIDRGREELEDRDLPRVIADGIAGGVWHCVHRFVRDGRTAELPAQLPQLMYFVVLPYLGLEAAREELRRPSGR